MGTGTRYEVAPHRGIGPARLGMDKNELIAALGPPLYTNDPSWFFVAHPLVVTFAPEGAANYICGFTHRSDAFVLNGIDLTGDLREVSRRLRSGGYAVVRGNPDPTLGDSPLFLPSEDVSLFSNEGEMVDDICVVAADYWDWLRTEVLDVGREHL